MNDTNHEYTSDQGNLPASLPVSFRTVVILVTLLVLGWGGLSVTHYYQTRQLIRTLFERETQEMGALLALGERTMARIAARLESEQANRLLAAGFWLRDLELHHPLTDGDLDRAVDSAQIFNVVVFDSKGRREIGYRGGAPPWAGGRGRGPYHAVTIEQFLQKDLPYSIEGLHPSGGFGGNRFSILVRRHNGGVISINIDAQAQEELIAQFGPHALLEEFVTKSNVLYAYRMVQNRVEERYGEIPSNNTALEIELLLSKPENEKLIVGFDNRPLVENNRILMQRMLLSIGIVCIVGFLILAGARLQKRYLHQSTVLRQLKSYHRAVLDTMKEAVIAWDENGRLTFWNPKSEHLFPELIQQPPIDKVPPSIDAIHEKVQNSSQNPIVEFGNDQQEIRRYRAEETAIADPLPARVLFLTDVTDVENAVRERDRREHLEALAKVASGVAHEVRNPLNAIDMSIQNLCMEPSTLQPGDKAVLESLRGEIQRINSIVEHFLAYGRPQPPILSEVDFNILVRDAASFLNPALQEKKMRLSLDLAPSANVQADAQQVKQALLNIVLNSIDASREGMEILLQTEEREDRVVCRCRDRGVGMTPEQIQTIFDPYVTYKPGGTGLGMSIVKRILNSHGGDVNVKSAPGEGTVIELHFPKSLSL